MMHFDRFSTCDGAKTYEDIKAAALKAGKFSCFEASATSQMATWFTRLCRDPDIVIVEMGYPLTGIRLKQKPEMSKDVNSPRDPSD